MEISKCVKSYEHYEIDTFVLILQEYQSHIYL